MQTNPQEYVQQMNRIIAEVKKAVVGKDVLIAKILLAVLANGNVLMEDMPGVGKTTMALAFSRALSLSYKRMQFTPDVLPSDLTGFSIYQKSTEKFVFQPGALFCQLFLADEINRTSSKTHNLLCSKRWRNIPSPLMDVLISCHSRISSLQRKIRLVLLGRKCCRNRRWIASCSG